MEAIETAIEVGERPRESVPWLTVERVGYIVVGLLAAALRLAELGLRPLNEAEAMQALAALRFTDGALQAAPSGTIPGLFTGNVVAFTLMGSGDAITIFAYPWLRVRGLLVGSKLPPAAARVSFIREKEKSHA